MFQVFLDNQSHLFTLSLRKWKYQDWVSSHYHLTESLQEHTWLKVCDIFLYIFDIFWHIRDYNPHFLGLFIIWLSNSYKSHFYEIIFSNKFPECKKNICRTENLSAPVEIYSVFHLPGTVSESNLYAIYITGDVTGSYIFTTAKNVYVVCQNDFSTVLNNINCALIATLDPQVNLKFFDIYF